MRKLWMTCLMMLAFAPALFAQVTTGSIIGFISSSDGKGLNGATVEGTHEPTGTRYKTSSGADGRFILPALRVGGPYTVTVSFVGYEKERESNIIVQLGEATRVDISMITANQNLQEVVISGTRRGALISKDRKGTSTNINRRVLATMPTLNRSFTDFTRFTPQANGTSFGGQDNRFINLTIDGSIFNNSFGLQALPGSQTNSAPISLDALEEIQVNISPYNLKDAGFTGASINAVTRSGTNALHGTAFYNFRNENLTGTKAGEKGKKDVVTSAFDVKQFGASLGGPIIKNKLFFFVNYEAERRTDPGTTWTADRGTGSGGNVTRVKATDLDQLSSFLVNNFQYVTGGYDNYSLATKSDKWLGKIDWNINDIHRFSIRVNRLVSSRDVPMSSSGALTLRNGNVNSLNYENSNYEINNNIFSVIGQLNSKISNKINNEIIFGYTANRDFRAEKTISFPTVDILDGNNVNYISFGAEPFTPNNILSTDTWQFSDNLSIYKGKHIISMGVNFEYFKFFNQFTPNINGQYIFNTLDDFYTSANAWLANNNMNTNPVPLRRYNLTFSNRPGGELWNSVTQAYNVGFYVQDDVPVNDKLSITYGIRFDVPFFGSTGFVNKEVDTLKFVDENNNPTRLSTSELPTAKLMVSPRFGFNYDVSGNKRTQIRGGLGLFSGRPAFVWISNQIGNNGVLSGSLTSENTTQFPFSPDPTRNIPNIPKPGEPAPSYNIATTERDFRFPQVFRTNLGIDQRIFKDIVLSGEIIFTQSLSNMFYYNANLKEATARFSGPDNRPRYATFNPVTGGALGNVPFNQGVRINTKITDATVLKSGPYGHSFMTTVKLEKPIRAKGFGFMLAYNYGNTRDYISAGSIAFSSWRDNRSVNGNNRPDLSYSNNDITNRIIGNLSYRTEFAEHAAFQVTLAGESINQGRFSYSYSGDMNGDGIAANDLLYIPRNKDEMNFQQYTSVVAGQTLVFTVDAQKEAFEKFIQQDPYLRNHRGSYATRNGVILPMVTRFDLSAMVELFTKIGKQRHTIQLRADIFNFGNLLNSAWGVGYVVNTTTPLAARGYIPATGVPVFRMNTVSNSLNYTTTRRGTSLVDVWQAQFGVRYIF